MVSFKKYYYYCHYSYTVYNIYVYCATIIKYKRKFAIKVLRQLDFKVLLSDI